MKNLVLTLVLMLLHTYFGSAQNHFTCEDGSKINIEYLCDGKYDCNDSSDEIPLPPFQILIAIGASGSIPSDELVVCFHPREYPLLDIPCLVPKHLVCSGAIICHDRAPCNIGCPDYYECVWDGFVEPLTACAKRSNICDGETCEGCSTDDEWSEGIGFKCTRQGKSCKIPQRLLWDGVKDCDDGSDVCFDSMFGENDGRNLSSLGYNTTFNETKCFQCIDGSMIIPRIRLCDGKFDCSDLSDECLCESNVPDICKDISMAIQNGDDLKTSSCEVGQISCGDGNCIDRNKVCDSNRDCMDARDERTSYCGDTLACEYGSYMEANQTCRCDTYCTADMYAILCNGIKECHSRPGYFEPSKDECAGSCIPPYNPDPSLNVTVPLSLCSYGGSGVGLGQSYYPCNPKNRTADKEAFEKQETCDGEPNCSNHYDEFNCTDRFYCQAGRLVNIALHQVCDGRVDCNDGSDELQSNCTDRFYCPSLGGLQVSIDSSLVCDQVINCDDNTDELDCGTADRFYCENGSPLFVPRRFVFNGRSDCSDQSDECPITSTERRQDSVFSSRFELIGNPVLRALVWIMGLLAIFGNLAVIVGECRVLPKLLKKAESSTLRANHVLILNLAVADLLMGVYLITLGIATSYYSEIYCVNSLAWLSGITCQAMGVLVTLSSETSVLTLLFLTMFRLYGILKPIASKTRSRKRVITGFVFISWFLPFLLAFSPFASFFQSVYVNYAYIPNHKFNDIALTTFSNYKTYAERLITFDPEFSNLTQAELDEIKAADSWIEMESIPAFKQDLRSALHFGYYSSNSACIPKLFVTSSDRVFLPSIIVNTFNFVSFVFVAASYLVIYIRSKSGGNLKPSDSNRKKSAKSSKVERKILRLVITDFFCWIPITVMVFINFSGIPVPDVAYAVSAIVLLPINSALNPILYSDYVDRIVRHFRTEFQRHRNSFLSFTRTTQDTRL